MNGTSMDGVSETQDGALPLLQQPEVETADEMATPTHINAAWSVVPFYVTAMVAGFCMMGLEILAFLGNAGKPQQPALEAAIKRSDDFIQECIDMVRSDELAFLDCARLPSRLAHRARDPFRRIRTATTGTRGTMSSIASRM